MLRNPKGATSLRWLQVLLDGGIEVHGQIVVCPGVNDGPALEDTLAGILDRYPRAGQRGRRPARPEPLLQRARDAPAQSRRGGARPRHASRSGSASSGGPSGAAWSSRPTSTTSWPGATCPRRATTRATPSTRTASAWRGPSPRRSPVPDADGPGGVRHGFFASVDAAPAEGYRAPRLPTAPAGRDERPVVVLTGTYGARVLAPLLAAHPRHDVALRAVPNDFFGGNIGVAGLLTGEDVARALAGVPDRTRCLLPDACLNEGRFLDGLTLADLPRPVEVVPTDGGSLRPALDGTSFRPACAS